MDLYNGDLYWPAVSSGHKRYKPLNDDIECDVLIIGGGLSGSMCAYLLSEYGVDAVLVEKGEIASGVTGANTGSLQFISDKMLSTMIKELGEEKAVYFYKLCLQAVDEMYRLASAVKTDTGFERRNSMYFASTKTDVKQLKADFDLLVKHGFPVTYMDREEIESKFPLSKPAGIYSLNAAKFDPFKYNHALVDAAAGNGIKVYENTRVTSYELGDASQVFETSGGRIKCRKVVFATGYETLDFIKTKKFYLTQTHVFVTKPLSKSDLWYQNCHIWETSRPYRYIRLSDDHRLIMGGLDERISHPVSSVRKIKKKTEQLIKLTQDLFPQMNFEVDYEYNAVFAKTLDGRPLIGPHPDYKNAYFLLGFGGNGALYSMLGATIIRDMLLYNYHPAQDIVRLDRFE